MLRDKVCNPSSVFAALILAGFMLTTLAVAADQEKVIYSFRGGADGNNPSPNLLADSAGNFYGTSTSGGVQQLGTVFELSPKAGGGWKEKTLYTFQGGTDGADPSSGLIADAVGNLYGETGGGGSASGGTVYELSPSKNGWTETVLYSFLNQNTGMSPGGGLVFDAAGNLYGTTAQGGQLGLGLVFQLTPDGKGNWTAKVIHAFGKGRDGGLPAGLTIDSQGNLFGTTFAGYEVAGAAYELTPQRNGKWKRTVLHGFTGGKDGEFPSGNLILDAAGNLYGTAESGGAASNSNGCDFGCGTVFKLTPGAKAWTFSVLYSFTGGQDGRQPDGTLAFDASGNLYGTTETGGGTGCDFGYGCGTAFELSPSAKGPWTEAVLHSFQKQPDGLKPQGALLPDSQGNWYGTTSVGGANSDGTVFKITP
jgi:uncharacterized repeat protein (TIGR03803 family)